MITTLILGQSDVVSLLAQAGATTEDAKLYAAPLLEAAHSYSIKTPLRFSHWLAQLMHESGNLKYTEELASGAAYEGRKDLGNTRSGDGKRFKGRGLIQLTGRANVTRYGRYRNDTRLVDEPERLARLPLSVDSAGWFWCFGTTQNLNHIADKDNVTLITRLINGGLNGLRNRKRLLAVIERLVDEMGTFKVQKALNSLSVYPTVTEDGVMGQRTVSVLKELQSDYLFPTCHGDVDTKTWEILKWRVKT